MIYFIFLSFCGMIYKYERVGDFYMIERYSRNCMKELWSEETKFSHMLEVEIAASHAFTKLGIVPLEDYQRIKENAKFTVDRIHEIEAVTKHDVIAFTRCVSESLGDERKWVHYGLTSTDVVDTAQSITLKKVNTILLESLDSFILVLKKQALKYKNTPCMGRTHGIHAEVTSFGLKWARWYEEMMRNRIRFLNARKNIEVGKISGAVGNFANTPPFVEESVCEELGIGVAKISTQVLPRDLHIEYINALASIATTIEEIAMEVRSLSRTEIHELQEHFTPGQKGSSAMPHKRNPIASENMCGCARVVRGYVSVAYENNLLWHERDISHSSAERIMLSDASTLVDYMLTRYQKTLANLDIFENRMIRNINLTYGVIFSGRVVSAIIQKGVSREKAYDEIQPLTMKAYDEGIMFIDLLKESKFIKSYLTDEEIDACFDLNYYMKGNDTIYKRIGLGGNVNE